MALNLSIEHEKAKGYPTIEGVFRREYTSSAFDHAMARYIKMAEKRARLKTGGRLSILDKDLQDTTLDELMETPLRSVQVEMVNDDGESIEPEKMTIREIFDEEVERGIHRLMTQDVEAYYERRARRVVGVKTMGALGVTDLDLLNTRLEDLYQEDPERNVLAVMDDGSLKQMSIAEIYDEECQEVIEELEGRDRELSVDDLLEKRLVADIQGVESGKRSYGYSVELLNGDKLFLKIPKNERYQRGEYPDMQFLGSGKEDAHALSEHIETIKLREQHRQAGLPDVLSDQIVENVVSARRHLNSQTAQPLISQSGEYRSRIGEGVSGVEPDRYMEVYVGLSTDRDIEVPGYVVSGPKDELISQRFEPGVILDATVELVKLQNTATLAHEQGIVTFPTMGNTGFDTFKAGAARAFGDDIVSSDLTSEEKKSLIRNRFQEYAQGVIDRSELFVHAIESLVGHVREEPEQDSQSRGNPLTSQLAEDEDVPGDVEAEVDRDGVSDSETVYQNPDTSSPYADPAVRMSTRIEATETDTVYENPDTGTPYTDPAVRMPTGRQSESSVVYEDPPVVPSSSITSSFSEEPGGVASPPSSDVEADVYDQMSSMSRKAIISYIGLLTDIRDGKVTFPDATDLGGHLRALQNHYPILEAQQILFNNPTSPDFNNEFLAGLESIRRHDMVNDQTASRVEQLIQMGEAVRVLAVGNSLAKDVKVEEVADYVVDTVLPFEEEYRNLQAQEQVVSHTDYHGKNIIPSQGRIVPIDLDDMQRTPRIFDFMRWNIVNLNQSGAEIARSELPSLDDRQPVIAFTVHDQNRHFTPEEVALAPRLEQFNHLSITGGRVFSALGDILNGGPSRIALTDLNRYIRATKNYAVFAEENEMDFPGWVEEARKRGPQYVHDVRSAQYPTAESLNLPRDGIREDSSREEVIADLRRLSSKVERTLGEGEEIVVLLEAVGEVDEVRPKHTKEERDVSLRYLQAMDLVGVGDQNIARLRDKPLPGASKVFSDNFEIAGLEEVVAIVSDRSGSFQAEVSRGGEPRGR